MGRIHLKLLHRLNFRLFIPLIAILIPIYSFAKTDSTDIKKLNDRVKNIEDYKTVIDKVGQIETQKFKNEIDQKIIKYEEEIANLRSQHYLWSAILSFLLLGGLWAYFQKIKELKKDFNDKIEKEVNDILQERFEIIRKITDEKNNDTQKIINTQIAILRHPEANNDSFVFASASKFLPIKNISSPLPLKKLKDFSTKLNPDTKVIIIDNEDFKWGKEEIADFIENGDPQKIYMTFGGDFVKLPREKQSNFSSASMRSQFLPNLINFIKYSI